MAQKRSLLNEIPPVSTSEEEESASEDEKQEQESKIKPKSKPESDDDEEEEEVEEESEDEEEIEKPVPVKDKKSSVQKHSAAAAAATVTPTKKPQSSSETDADDGSGSESDSGDTQKSPTASAFTIKPNFSKPVAACSESKKPASKSTSQVHSTPSKSTGKRLTETQQNGKDSQRKKSKVSEEDGKTEEKKSVVTRVWSDKDEIAILDGMIRYKSEKGLDPTTDTMAFKEFLKDSIRSDVSKSQLSEKIRRLKKKYLTNAEKGENGEDPALLKPHDYKIFKLSKKIWGSLSTITNAGENNGTSSKKSKKIEPKEDSKSIVTVAEPKVETKTEQVKEDEEMDDKKDLCSVYPRLNEMFNIEGYLAEDTKRFLKENIGLIGSSRAKELDEKWKNLQIEEFEVYSKRMSLMNEQRMLVLDALKASKN